MHVNYQTPSGMLVAYGALRPAIGAVFGMVVFALINGGLIPALAVPRDNGALVGFCGSLAFLAGFNERFAQDMLAGAARVLPDPDKRVSDASGPRVGVDRSVTTTPQRSDLQVVPEPRHTDE